MLAEADIKGRVVLLGSVFVVAACGLVYELVAGAVSSYILGDAVTQFSLVIGVFLCAMGVGSYLAKFITRNLLEAFIEIEIWIGLLGGTASITMFAVSAFAQPIFPVVFYLLCAIVGILVGIEIPVLVRILKEGQGISEALSHVLALDYVGALAGSVLFPLVVLPFLGLSRSSVVFGLMNLAVAAIGLKLIKGPKRWTAFRIMLVISLLIGALVYSPNLVGFFEDVMYQDNVVLAKDSPYQRIVITRWRNDIRLYLNGHLQFCSIDEPRYHEALVIPVMEATAHPRNVLILGGGDGLAAREALKYQSVEKILLVDIDPTMTTLGRQRKELLAINGGSLNSSKVRIVNQDAMKFLQQDTGFYDIAIVDLPDPETESLAKLYSKSFYELLFRRLSSGGSMVTQAASPFFAPDAFWCIAKTIAEAFKNGTLTESVTPLPYHLNVPSFGEWGFVMATKHSVDPTKLSPSVTTRYLNAEALRAMFSFSKDMQPREVEVNKLDNPILFTYYKRGWKNFND